MSLLPEHEFPCPYCACPNITLVDLTGGTNQEFVTDCEICCRPILIRLRISQDQLTSFDALME